MNPRRAAIGLACLALAALPRHWLEASMLRHMLLQLPLLVAAGWMPARRRSGANPGALARYDEHGVCGLTALLFITAYWMIPRALEQSINTPWAEVAKFISLIALGAILPGSLKRANWIVQLFFLGNFSWMMAIAGIQYQDMPQRLCNAYLLDDQAWTGAALVAASVAIAIAWCWRLAPAFSNNPSKANHHVSTATDA
ncbi:hypothetical protein [Rugamonas rivuli]|uniref:Transmembrane protein n=1 Tax=Rugamonas rivuli TaxID=2743358 RepID=A0A843S1W7_9BURK|nr:hypothetical protein [Rugamonas rivuli]MQA18245.1 hypothetical protein [Rugamonas rivuli]